jgi:hypothetical protein
LTHQKPPILPAIYPTLFNRKSRQIRHSLLKQYGRIVDFDTGASLRAQCALPLPTGQLVPYNPI